MQASYAMGLETKGNFHRGRSTVNKIGAHAFEAKVAPVLRSLAMSFSTLLYFVQRWSTGEFLSQKLDVLLATPKKSSAVTNRWRALVREHSIWNWVQFQISVEPLGGWSRKPNLTSTKILLISFESRTTPCFERTTCNVASGRKI